MKNKFKVNFWENSNNVCYAQTDLFDNLSKKDMKLLENLLKRIERYENYTFEQLIKSNYLEKIDNDLWELKFHLQSEVRFIGTINDTTFSVFESLVHFKKKTQKIETKYINKAKERLKEYKKYESQKNSKVIRN